MDEKAGRPWWVKLGGVMAVFLLFRFFGSQCGQWQAQTDGYSPPTDRSPRPSVETPTSTPPPAPLPDRDAQGPQYGTIRRLHGKPSKVEYIEGDITKWWYGKEWIEFERGGIVKGWSPGFRPTDRSPRPSVAKSPSTGSPPAVLPSKRSTLSPVFTVGSTFATVRRFHGKPSKMEWIRGNTTKWHYGKEWVEFNNGTVKGWSPGFRFLRMTKSDSGGTP